MELLDLMKLLGLSAKILIEHFKLFMTLTDHADNVEIMIEKEEDKKEKVTRNRL